MNSAFGPKCPSCFKRLPPATFNAGFDHAWRCLACESEVCTYCYGPHTAAEHPDLNVEKEAS